MRSIALHSAALVLAAASVSAADEPAKIQTSGNVTVTVPADRVHLTVGVSAKADKAKDAAARVGVTLNAVRDALVRFGLDRNTLPSAGYSVTADFGEPNKPSGYVATSALSVELSNLSQLGAVVDTALGAGANEVTNIRFLPRDEQAARARALEMAVKEARDDAEVLAKASGTTLGPLLRLTTQRVSPVSFALAETIQVGRASRATDIPAPEISISASVQAEWAVK